MKQVSLLLVQLLLGYYVTLGQCTTTISTFPYTENFEANNGGWNSGGVNSDWAWGIPSKAYIQTAGSGQKCWMTGGVNGSFYNFSQRSYVESPCFNFTNLTNPHVQFLIYWEGENQYDGTVFQYSLNNGLTWNNVGSVNDPVDCLNQNWFNINYINALSNLATPQQGWAGTVLPTQGSCFGGNGSGGWVLAKHCMPYLAGVNNVRFRFAFGSGTTCNDFDGVAFDQITIGEASSLGANFTYACNGTHLTYQFNNTSTCANSYSWNFDDPTSGSANVSFVANPVHMFTEPGIYDVTLTITGPCNSVQTVQYTIVTLDMTVNVANTSCVPGSTGSIQANAFNNTMGTVSYTLNPGNLSNTNGLFTPLTSNTYTVSYLDSANCRITKSVVVNTGNNFLFNSFFTTPISCNGYNNGGINVTTVNGFGTVNYSLFPGGSSNTSGSFSNLTPNIYTVVATDGNGCTISSIANIPEPPPLIINTVSAIDVLCYGSMNGSININASGGSGGKTYNLFPAGLTNFNGQFTGLDTGSFQIVVVDANGCSQTGTAIINQPPPLLLNSVQLTQPSCTFPQGGSIVINASGGYGSLSYSLGGGFVNTNLFTNLSEGSYTITVKDANQCIQQSTVVLNSNNALTVQLVASQNPKCFNGNDGSLILLANSNTTISNYTILPGGQNNTTGIFNNLTANNYTITVTDQNGCTKTLVAYIANPEAISIQNISVFNDTCGRGGVNKISATGFGGTTPYTYTLFPGNLNSNDGKFEKLLPNIYLLVVNDANQCSDSARVVVEGEDCCIEPFIANAFSPNRDGLNDELHINVLPGVTVKKFIIVNRFGNVVFEPKHEEDRWDGNFKSTPCDVGSYFYMLQYQCNRTKEEYILKGDITLLR